MEKLNKVLVEVYIEQLVNYAKENGKVFLFGDVVFDPDEAKDAMLSTWDDDCASNEWDEDDYYDEMKKCIFDKE